MSKAFSIEYGGKTGLYIVKSGYSLETPNLPADAFLFDSRWFTTVRVVARVAGLISSFPTETVTGYGTVRRIYDRGSAFPRPPHIVHSFYSTRLSPPRITGGLCFQVGAKCYLKDDWFTGANDPNGRLVAYILDFPEPVLNPPAGTAGTRRVRFSPNGVYVAADPHEAVTASVDNHLIHPDIKLPQAITTVNAVGTSIGGNIFRSETTIDWSDYQNRLYISTSGALGILFPNASTMRLESSGLPNQGVIIFP